MATTSVRVPDELLEALDRMAQAEHVDRSAIIRRALEEGLQDLSLKRAIETYQRGGVSAWKAARSCEVSLWAFLDELERRGLPFRTDEGTLEDQLDALQGEGSSA